MLEIGLWMVGAILARQDQRENIARVETQYYMQRVWSIIPGRVLVPELKFSAPPLRSPRFLRRVLSSLISTAETQRSPKLRREKLKSGY